MKRFFYLIFLLIFLIQCKKENDKSVPANIYSPIDALNHEGIYLFPAQDGSTLLFSISEKQSTPPASVLLQTKYDPSGKLVWQKELPYEGGPYITELNDGGLLIISSSFPRRIMRMDRDGKMILNTISTDSLNAIVLKATEYNDQFYSTLNKNAPWGSDTNVIVQMDKTGQVMTDKSITTRDYNFNGLMASQYIYKVESPQVYYFCGLIYENPVNLWQTPHIYVSRFEYSGKNLVSTKNVQFDVSNQEITNDAYNFHFLNIPDQKLLILSQQLEPNKNYRSQLMKIDKDLKREWSIVISAGIGNTFGNSVRLCPDGGYLIVGDCKVSGKIVQQPFAMKVSEDGKILWTKTFELNEYGRFTSGYQDKNGNIILGGSSLGFGSGNNLKDLLLIRTNSNGNIE